MGNDLTIENEMSDIEIQSETTAKIDLDIQNNKNKLHEIIHSPEFIEKFGDWEKAQRLEKLKNDSSIEVTDRIMLNGQDVTSLVNSLRSEFSKENLRDLQKIATQIGKTVVNNIRKSEGLTQYDIPILKNIDTQKNYKLASSSIGELREHNIFQKGHIEAIQYLDELITRGIYIGSEKNEDNRKPDLEEFYYFAKGIKIRNDDYTAKIVFTRNKNGELFYDQSLSTVEKGRFIELVNEKKPEAFNPVNSLDSNELFEENNSPSNYYDKRLINICQVPQMPYLDENLLPTIQTVKDVQEGKLFVEKVGQQYVMRDLIKTKTAVLDIVDPDKEKMQLSAETLKLSDGKIPSELKILKQDYLEKCSFLPPMKISDGKAHIYADIGDVADELMTRFPTQATETEKQKTKHVELVISEQLLGGMTAAAMLHAKSKGKTPAFPPIQQMTDEYRDGMKRTFPEITDREIEKTYKNAYKISAMSMSKSVSMQQSRSRGIDSY